MKTLSLLFLVGLLTPTFAPRQTPPQQEKPKPAEKKPRAKNPVTAFFDGEAERLTTGVQGSWVLFEYDDPHDAPLDGEASGFATFQDGFLTLILSIDTYESNFFGAEPRLLLSSGAYRYRFDQQAFLQLSSVMSFTNETDSGDLERDPSEQSYEYYAQLDDGVLELRNSEGIHFSFRKVSAGDFPETAIRRLEGRRSGTQQYELPDEGRR